MYSPRMRGGQPSFMATLDRPEKFSPHARGSTQSEYPSDESSGILPVCAGVNQRVEQSGTKVEHSSRMRGGQPHVQVQWLYDDAFTPHARGSTPFPKTRYPEMLILPACARVNPPNNRHSFVLVIHPACAGVNLYPPCDNDSCENSPRMRGGQPLLLIVEFARS